MITADQILAHLVGDYILQSDRMARLKRTDSIVCASHAIRYAIPILFLRPSISAYALIVAAHFLVDRFGLARYVVWAKNRFWGDGPPWHMCRQTGYPPSTPDFLATWLTIIADNTLHLLCNGLALRYL